MSKLEESIVKAREAARHEHAKRRIQKLLDTSPPLTAEHRRELAEILYPALRDDHPETAA